MTAIDRLRQPTAILPLVVFRVAFGLLMFASTIRFMANGWIDEFYLRPDFHFTYYGFSWVRPLPGPGLYLVYGAVALLSLAIAAGLFYRASIIAFFLLFTYTELLDKTYYLNHYYFISVLSFLLIFLPLHRNFSVDTLIRPNLKTAAVPTWTVAAIRLQVGLVYFFAGVAKLNYDWLANAMPLKIWLAARTDTPLIGRLFDYSETAYLMSWAGAAYDLTIPFLLLYRPTRPLAYLAVIAFHLMTGWLFNIGMFPYIMMACTLIFFPADDWHWLRQKVVRIVSYFVTWHASRHNQNIAMKRRMSFRDRRSRNLDGYVSGAIRHIKLMTWPSRFLTALRSVRNDMCNKKFARMTQICSGNSVFRIPTLRTTPHASRSTSHVPRSTSPHPALLTLLILFLSLQLLLPLRHWLYPGNVLWTEEGYRFAWKVMLAEKTGHVTFTVTNPASGQSWAVFPGDYLTPQQEKQMSFQPDMILEFAHYLAQQMQAQGLAEVEIRAEAYVSLNGRPSRLLLDPTVDLTTQRNSLAPKSWIRQY